MTLQKFIAAIFFQSLFSVVCIGQQKTVLDPSGFYIFTGKTVTKDNDTYGYFGNAKVLQVGNKHIAVHFFICKGAPSYNSGSFIDTLTYRDGRAVYRGDGVSDTTCRLSFHFYKSKFSVQLMSDNINFACGFGHAVDAYGTFRKIGKRKPTRKQLERDDEVLRPTWALRKSG